MALILRTTNGAPLTWEQGDQNLIYLYSGSLYTPHSGSVTISGSIQVSGSVTASGFFGTASYASHALNASVAISSSYALNADTASSVYGAVSVTSALLLNAQNPLPIGVTGSLAVSASNIYFYNGSGSAAGWAQII